MNALWWWIDRWRKSTAYTDMTLEQQGAYRNLLDEATLRGGPLPADDRVLAKACGDALAWKRVKGSVMQRFTLTTEGWRNETLDEVLKQSKRRAANQLNYRNRAGHKTDNTPDNGGANGGDNKATNKPDYPDPDPDPIKKESPTELLSFRTTGSKRPIFSGQRFTVFEWQLEGLERLLGPWFMAFDIHEWFFTLDQQTLVSKELVPQRDNGAWLLSKTQAEALRRGLSMASAASAFDAAYAELIKKGPSVRS